MTVLNNETFKSLRDFIYAKSGIFIPDNKKYFIENRLIKRLEEKKIATFEDYLYVLRYDRNDTELTALFDKITTNETFFFREIKQLDILVDKLAPEIYEKRINRTIKIWSAACSTGEEPYSIAMMLKENTKTNPVKFDVYASDISDAVLAKAKNAVYGQYSMRNVPDNYKRKYFNTLNKNEYILKQEIKSHVRLMNINLLNDRRLKFLTDMDVIFCRNVLIYFDNQAKKKVVTNLYNALKPEGYLIIGMAESLHDITKAFRPHIINHTVVYKKT
ncbi:chemotaxis protein methyltransferase CheR [Candidatus Magnetoovum chiemensis]|nr:chemotaxis protein methyltransferase CheR [Candidatus Magnetoovum chiemensis]